MKPPETCPVCGADVPARAKACPRCGACEKTGWSEEAYASGLDLPDEDFDYEDFVEREFGTRKPLRPRGIKPFWWWITVAVILGSLIWMVLSGLSNK